MGKRRVYAQPRLTQPWHTLFSCVPRLCQPWFDDFLEQILISD